MPDPWVQNVMATSFATEPPPGIFTMAPSTIADASDVEGVAPKGLTSWQRMVLFHKNRGGKGLSDDRKQALQDAIRLLSERRKVRLQSINTYHKDTLLPHTMIDPKTFSKRLGEEAANIKTSIALNLPFSQISPMTSSSSNFPLESLSNPNTGEVKPSPGQESSDATKQQMKRKIQNRRS